MRLPPTLRRTACSAARIAFDSRVRCHVAPFDDDARQPAEDDLDQASLIDSAARSVDIKDPHAHALDRGRKLP